MKEECFWQPEECTDGLTVSIWYKSEFTDTFTVLFTTTDDIPGSTGIQIAVTSSYVGITLHAWQISTVIFTPYSDENSWHHLVGVWYLNGTMSLYLDGDLTEAYVAYNAKDPPEGEHNHTVYVGNDYANQSYVGYLDEILFWKEVKDAQFIRKLYEHNPKIGNVLLIIHFNN